ncbi:hypothetical protein LCGC14_0745430 [marine sediment metagenome]|uniref:Uncharacterized protein n=1 Tax=marine sediment metagenome TaxID=412755 RepID=A0A0F9Q5M4_9ZZZZ
MEPVEPTDAPGRKVVFAAEQADYLPLVAHFTDGGTVLTRWRPNENERRAIMDGACIDLEVMTFGQPLQPLHVTVQGVNEPSWTGAPDDPAP